MPGFLQNTVSHIPSHPIFHDTFLSLDNTTWQPQPGNYFAMVSGLLLNGVEWNSNCFVHFLYTAYLNQSFICSASLCPPRAGNSWNPKKCWISVTLPRFPAGRQYQHSWESLKWELSQPWIVPSTDFPPNVQSRMPSSSPLCNVLECFCN